MPRASSCKIQLLIKILSTNAVADLIDANECWWNMQLLKDVFIDEDTKIY